MSTRKTLDIDPAVSALLARIDKLKTDSQLKLGEIVTETGITKLVDADELREILARERDRILADRARTQEHGTAKGTFPEKPAPLRKANGHADPEPGRPRAPDLLGGTEAE